MADHTKYVTFAKRLIAKHGRKVRLQLLAERGEDPTKPWKGASVDNVENEYQAMAAFIPAAGRDLGTIVEDKDLLKSVSHVCVCEAIAQGLEDRITRVEDTDGTMWRVVWMQTLKPGTLSIIYTLGLAK